MPLNMPDNLTDDYFIVGSDALGVDGAVLATGQTISVVSSDPATVIITPDATPRANPTDGSACVASGKVSSAQPPAKPNTAVNVTASIANADASAGPSITDTVTITPGALASVGELFGTPA
jgi:hypothetical protein